MQDTWRGRGELPEIIGLEDAEEILCFPRPDPSTCSDRIKKLRKKGVTGIVSYGSLELEGFRVLGKGFSSIVVAAMEKGGRVIALKIRRMDSRRPSLIHEADLLAEASEHRLAPRIYWWDRDFIAMEYLQGAHLEDINSLGLSSHETRMLLARLLGKAFVLDLIGIDHGELRRPYRHVIIVGLEPFFIDFESASKTRKPHNLTSLASALLISKGRLTSFFRNRLGSIDKDAVLDALRVYKRCRAKGYQLLLERLGLLDQGHPEPQASRPPCLLEPFSSQPG